MATTARKSSKSAAKKATKASKATKATKTSKATKAANAQPDWTYLAEKDPTDLHEDMAKWITEVTGVSVDVKTVQLVAILRMPYQRSDRNKKRTMYRGLPDAVVQARSEHMRLAAEAAKAVLDAEAAKKQPAKAAKAATTKPHGGRPARNRRARVSA